MERPIGSGAHGEPRPGIERQSPPSRNRSLGGRDDASTSWSDAWTELPADLRIPGSLQITGDAYVVPADPERRDGWLLRTTVPTYAADQMIEAFRAGGYDVRGARGGMAGVQLLLVSPPGQAPAGRRASAGLVSVEGDLAVADKAEGAMDVRATGTVRFGSLAVWWGSVTCGADAVIGEGAALSGPITSGAAVRVGTLARLEGRVQARSLFLGPKSVVSGDLHIAGAASATSRPAPVLPIRLHPPGPDSRFDDFDELPPEGQTVAEARNGNDSVINGNGNGAGAAVGAMPAPPAPEITPQAVETDIQPVPAMPRKAAEPDVPTDEGFFEFVAHLDVRPLHLPPSIFALLDEGVPAVEVEILGSSGQLGARFRAGATGPRRWKPFPPEEMETDAVMQAVAPATSAVDRLAVVYKSDTVDIKAWVDDPAALDTLVQQVMTSAALAEVLRGFSVRRWKAAP